MRCATALDMARALDGLNDQWRGEGRPTLGIGIGINSGEMIAGNIGAETIRSYTVIGDAVNLGARLESLNKDYGTHDHHQRGHASAPAAGRSYQSPAARCGDGQGQERAVEIFEVVTDIDREADPVVTARPAGPAAPQGRRAAGRQVVHAARRAGPGTQPDSADVSSDCFAAAVLAATPAPAQFGLDKIKKGADLAKKANDLHFTESRGAQLGAERQRAASARSSASSRTRRCTAT